MEVELKNIGINCWQVKKIPGMNADVVIFAKKEMLPQITKDQSLNQLIQAASLPKVISPVLGMPDIHEGFGLPIGGVMATNGLVSAGAVGMDINCGVRLLTSQLSWDSQKFSPELLRLLIRKIESLIPIGLGRKTKQKLPFSLEEIITQGVNTLLKKKFATPQDIESIEENGCLKGAEIKNFSHQAIKRAQKELGTLGSGNHFIEIQKIEEIFDEQLAKKWLLFKGQICVMLHSGSRALGHQTCLDYTYRFSQEQKKYGINPPNFNLSSLPADSPLGRAYLSAMAGAVNFAFANRQIMTFSIRQAFKEVFPSPQNELNLLYDVAHNIAKWETHKGKMVLVHRKGATRALPAGHPQNPSKYFDSGHPAIIPGSMGSASYVMIGLPPAEKTFYSINHGAGRIMSRNEAKKSINIRDFEQKMSGIIYNQPFLKIVDEAPQAYKNIDLVVETLVEAGLAKKVVRLEPIAVIKGD